MKLVLHIGTEKTGTTLLQEWLYRNRAALGRQGYYLSDTIGVPSNRHLVAYFRRTADDFWNRNGIRSAAEKAQFFDGFADRVRAEFARAARNHHTAIVTAEHFHSRLEAPEELAALAAFCREICDEVRVICYLRSQWDVRRSLYSTGLKTNISVPLAAFNADLTEDSPYYNYLALYRRWGAAFGPETLVFRRYARPHLAAGDLRRDFLAAMGGPVTPEALDFSVTSANESVNLLLGHALMSINKAVPLFAGGGMDKRNGFYKAAVTGVAALHTGRFPDDQGPKIAETFAASNAALSAEAFDGAALFDPPKAAPEAAASYSAAEVAEIVQALTLALVEKTAPRLLDDAAADVLRDAALKQDRKTAEGRAAALALMRLAARARPGGRFIQDKLADWEAQG